MFHLHLQKFLPHPALSNGERVFGAGEIIIENGRIIEINSKSGHYLPLNPDGKLNTLQASIFSRDSINAFEKFLRANGFSKEEIKKINFNLIIK